MSTKTLIKRALQLQKKAPSTDPIEYVIQFVSKKGDIVRELFDGVWTELKPPFVNIHDEKDSKYKRRLENDYQNA